MARPQQHSYSLNTCSAVTAEPAFEPWNKLIELHSDQVVNTSKSPAPACRAVNNHGAAFSLCPPLAHRSWTIQHPPVLHASLQILSAIQNLDEFCSALRCIATSSVRLQQQTTAHPRHSRESLQRPRRVWEATQHFARPTTRDGTYSSSSRQLLHYPGPRAI